MSQEQVIAIAEDALTTALLICAPVLMVTLAVGILVSLIQTMTSINEVTLTYVPKILAVFLVFALAGPWMMTEMTGMTIRMINSIPQYIR